MIMKSTTDSERASVCVSVHTQSEKKGTAHNLNK